MTKQEVTNYLKDLSNMNIVRNEIRGLRNIISERDYALAAERKALAQKDYALAQKDNALQKANARIAELEQKLKSAQ